MAKLVIVRPGQPDESHDLTGSVITVGRRPDNSITIAESSVSGRHAEFREESGRYRLKDLDSTNKTYVNGVPVAQALLRGSCTIRFGSIECLFEDGVAAGAAPAAGAAATGTPVPTAPATPAGGDSNMAQRLAAAEKRIRELQAELQSATTQLDNERKKVAALTLQDHTLHQTQQQLTAILKDTKEALTRALNDVDTLRAERQELTKRLRELENRATGRNGGHDENKPAKPLENGQPAAAPATPPPATPGRQPPPPPTPLPRVPMPRAVPRTSPS